MCKGGRWNRGREKSVRRMENGEDEEKYEVEEEEARKRTR